MAPHPPRGFGHGNALRLRSAGNGLLAPSAEPELRQGASAWAVDGGSGVFTHATGRIVSNFLLADTGDLTDHVLGVIFVGSDDSDASTPLGSLQPNSGASDPLHRSRPCRL